MRASEITAMLGKGYIILAGFNAARLVPRPKWLPEETQGFDVPYGTVAEMIRTHQLGEINEEGYPPVSERPKTGSHGWKNGWREMGLNPPAEGQAYYLMIQ
jgi:hypothetical protein